MFMRILILATVLLAGSSSPPVKHFRLVEKSELPKAFLQDLCGEVKDAINEKDCFEDFEKDGAVWAGDVNDDGQDEYIVDPGGMPGTLGAPRFLRQQRGNAWVDLLCLNEPEECDSSWNTLHARFDILPTVRSGYHDLRIEVDRCVKWDGRHYIDYDYGDYS